MASKALGRLARASGTLTADYVEFEVTRVQERKSFQHKTLLGQTSSGMAVVWTPRSSATRRGSSTERIGHQCTDLVLRARSGTFRCHALLIVDDGQAFVELIWGPLRDTKAAIREGAVEALRACLELIAERESRLRQQWYQKILEEARKSFRGSNSDHIHGSLLAIGELLRNAGDFMKSQFGEVCETVIKWGEKKKYVSRSHFF